MARIWFVLYLLQVRNRSQLLPNSSLRSAVRLYPMELRVASKPEQVRSAVDELLASETFARSEQLRSFLRYVCERALAGHGKEINEYSVAVEALGKPTEFSPGEDSSVRRAAYELRQKLQKYYEGEGLHATVRVELPKGSYTPRFVEPHAPVEEHPATAAVAMPPERSQRLVWILGASTAVLAALAIFLVSRDSRGTAPRLDSIVREAWRPLAEPGSDVLVSVGTTPAPDCASLYDGGGRGAAEVPGAAGVVSAVPVAPATRSGC